MKIVKLIVQTALALWLLTFVVTITSTLTPPTVLWAALLLSAIVLLVARSVVDRAIKASRRIPSTFVSKSVHFPDGPCA